MTPPIPCVRAELMTWFCEMVQGGLVAVVDGAALATVGVAMASRVPAPRTRVAPRPHRLWAFLIASSVMSGHPDLRRSGTTVLRPNAQFGPNENNYAKS